MLGSEALVKHRSGSRVLSVFRKARPGRGWGQEPGRAARSDLGRGLGEGGRRLVSLPCLVKAPKMAGGNTARGARRRHRGHPSARLRHPTSCSQRPHWAVSAARNWLNWASAPCGGGAATQRLRFPPLWCACAQSPLESVCARSRRSPQLAPPLPPLSGQACPVSEAVSAAASRGRSGPKSAAAPLACGKCHQMAG